MITIQDTIQNLKVEISSKFAKLKEEFVEINEDVNYYNSKVDEWAKPVRLNVYCNLEPIKPKSVKSRNHCKVCN